ncbi:MAG: lipid-A-disaccharide synthase [Betaproteobacteria bacterium]|nr:MAG: lipid-A-disaccharide synthase [Betaproteobacteria bacterium]
MNSAQPTIGMVAGEASGDLLGAHLIEALRAHLPHAKFIGIGGPKMQAQGLASLFPMERLAVRGYAEVLRHLPRLLRMRRKLKLALLEARPQLFIGVDAPDFNLNLEAGLKRAGVPVVHYVSPSIWAWRGDRIAAIGRAADQVLTLFPFEQAIYRKAGIGATYVGHPLADLIPEQDQTASTRAQLKIAPERKVIALLPGSRQSELRYMADTFIETAKLLLQKIEQPLFLVPLVSRETREIFEAALYRANATDLPLTILFGHARDALAAADVALVASGTATLEAALLKKPMVITYKMAGPSWLLMRRMGYLPYVGLPNILAGEFVVPELLQHDATPENLAQALRNALNDSVVRARLSRRFSALHSELKCNNAERAASAVLPLLARAGA